MRLLFDSACAEEVAELLNASGCRRLLDLPALPVRNAPGIRYPTVMPVLPGPTDWYVRSFGLSFNLVHPDWRRRGHRWYSLGWGLVDGAEVPELLLVQAWVSQPAAGQAVVDFVRARAQRYVDSAEADGDYYCFRSAAVLGASTGVGP